MLLNLNVRSDSQILCTHVSEMRNEKLVIWASGMTPCPVQLISLHLERAWISRRSVHQAYSIRSPRKSTAMEAAVVKLVSRGFAWKYINGRSVNAVTQIFMLFEGK